MKVGDYVRTKNGEIGKLVNVEVYYVLGQNDKDKFSCVLFNNSYAPCIVSNDFIIKKGQLIDLIEVGDYVNGLKVSRVGGTYHGRKDKAIYCDRCVDKETGKWTMIYDDEIKSIVTKEQFESMEYKVKENNNDSKRNV